MAPIALQSPQAVAEFQSHQHQDLSLVQRRSNFEILISSIRDTLGTNPELKFDDVDVDKLEMLLRAYQSSRSEWERFSFIDFSRNYTRNLVDNLHGNANLILMTWTPNKASLIHDHTSAHCVMRILQGHIIETRYEWPTPGVEEPLKVKQVRHYYAGDVAYMSDDLGIHKVENGDPDSVAVSLHLYTPPYIEKKGCNTFNAKTGKSCHIKLSEYYSREGERISKPSSH
ncbi:hypothetical protein TWF569_009169 [Orbilia oligospora]|uniref:Cysteine dioxygenase n=1 Tax=Orbilia oligospora TaxID=2813651 RepID=A0A7C8MYQ9_ORBOL|nr:hypothetical protein TWF102_003866 [Orbilia oligospora]KAF3080698.1 hypothetical protein TWF103_004011 [Orbilia oligospora]KAF3135329.1 hypothetical protein TWF594_008400 [Orbilia oligospora]KAF3137728.1 hypothetical protein TWF569_009169 [Orbilia oligospora]KAF3206350.1 hypothetical protein TWF106_000734 [Orbilia oligospora]